MSEPSSYVKVDADEGSDESSEAQAWEEVQEREQATDPDPNDGAVVVELPPEMRLVQVTAGVDLRDSSSCTSSVTGTSRMGVWQSLGKPKASSSSTTDEVVSVSSFADTHGSIVRGLSGIYIHSKRSFLSTMTYQSDSPTLGSETVISGFSYLELDGTSSVRCKRCKLSNSSESNVMLCNACDYALTANPCMDMDEQLARSIQLKEEDEALRSLQREEQKRQNVADMPLIEKAHFLAQDVQRRVDACRRGAADGIFPIPSKDLLVHAADMIENFTRLKRPSGVDVGYCFCRKEWEGSAAFDIIRLEGLPEGRMQLSSSADAAFGSAARGTEVAQHSQKDTAPSCQSNLGHLFPIQEGICVQESDYIGWIVLTANEKSSDGFRPSSALYEPSKAFPLVAFQADLRNSDQVNRLSRGLLQDCQDFFLTDWGASARDSDDTSDGQPSTGEDSTGNQSDSNGEPHAPSVSTMGTEWYGQPLKKKVNDEDLEMIRDCLNLSPPRPPSTDENYYAVLQESP
jgi:hypothetical protein